MGATTMNVNFLLWIAILLAIVWVVARVVGWVAGALFNVLIIVAVIMFVVWLFGRITRRV
jgi:hypothetical protein